jgi:hypothetical protein
MSVDARAQALYVQGEHQFGLGRMSAGRDLLRQAADAGHLQAALRLVQYLLHFEQEDGVDEALRRLDAGVGSGEPAALCIAASLVLGGKLWSERVPEVPLWIHRAASRGWPEARQAAALLYAMGDAVESTMVERQGADLAGGLESAAALDPHRLVACFERLQRPVPGRILCDSPRVALIDQVLPPLALAWLRSLALPRLRPSRVIDPVSGQAREDPLRTSSGLTIDPLQEDLPLRLIQWRMSVAAACPLSQAEPLLVLRYRPGEEYRPHRDYLSPPALASFVPAAGQRWRTCCTYLNPVASGGQTEFPLLGISVEPVPGASLVFDNTDSLGQPDARSLHAGRPVLEGEKWLSTLWFRQANLRPF